MYDCIQMHFEFKSSSLDLVESFWRFDIPQQHVSVPFLLVGQTRDPAIAFDRSHVNFRSVLIGESFLLRLSVKPSAVSLVDMLLL